MSKPKELIIALDFDGVMCKHARFPKIGDPVPDAVKWVKRFQAAGARVFLWTCRNKESLELATKYLKKQGLELEGYNSIDYGSDTFSPYPKLFANIYIDDAAFGAPLTRPGSQRGYLDWSKVGHKILERIKKRKRYL